MNHNARWTEKKIAMRLALVEGLVYRRRLALAPFRYLRLSSPALPPPAAQTASLNDWIEIVPHSAWAAGRTDFCLRSEFQLPAGWSAAEPTALVFDLGRAEDFEHPEALVYIDGLPYGACDRHHGEISLPGQWLDGRPHALALHGWTGIGKGLFGPGESRLQMGENALVQVDHPTRDFVALARTALGAAGALDAAAPAKGLLLSALDRAFQALDLREPQGSEFYASVAAATGILRERLAAAGPALEVEIVAIGHAHLDLAWLWTLDQTRRKAGRTFHNVLRLMEEFTEFTFAQSQPQLYDFVRQDYPELFQDIQRRVADGRWEPIGGMWVEADCNLSGPESLARQFQLGRSFFREHFGPEAESRVLWLPDVFGCAWNLPQLIKLAGLDYFFTIKIGWSQYNRLPFDSFWHRGTLDDTVAEAYGFNDPVSVWPGSPTARPAGSRPECAAMLWFEKPASSDSPQVVIETVKGAEDGRGIIVRFYECQRRRGRVRLQVGFSVRAAWLTDLLEVDQRAFPVSNGGIDIDIRPFQIITLRLLAA